MTKIIYPLLLCLFSMTIVVWCDKSCPTPCFCPREEEAICEFDMLNFEFPKNLPVKLKNLTINGGKFSELKDKDFSTYINLEKLQLTRNNIYKIHPYAFRNLTRLRSLSIQHNPLETLDEYSFGGLNNLSELILTNNQIRYVRKHAFYNSRNIQHFDLRSNPVERIESYAFSNVDRVDILHLPLYMKQIESDSFNNMSNVNFIELRYWRAADVQGAGVASNTFRGLSHVRSILIEKSHLGVLHSHAFAGLSHVGILSIEKGEIRKIKRQSFAGMTNVGILEINTNLIWTMERKALTVLHDQKNSMKITFTNNGLDCDCYNLMIFEEMANVSKENLFNNYCNVPEELSKKSLTSIGKDYIQKCRTVSFDSAKIHEEQSENAGAINYAHFSCLVIFVIVVVSKR